MALAVWTSGTAYAVNAVVAYGGQPWQVTVAGGGNSTVAPGGSGDGYTWVAVALPAWDSSFANAIKPSSGVLAAGYATDAEPPSTGLNWLLWSISNWLAWLAGILSYVNTWTANQIFSGGMTITGGLTVDTIKPTIVAPPIHTVDLSGVLTASNFLLDPNLGSKVGITAIHSGGNNVSFPATVAGGASAQFPIGGELTIWDQSLTANTKNVTFTQPAVGNGTKVNGLTSIQGLVGAGQVVKFVYLGSSGSYDNWQSMDPQNAD